MFQFNISRTDPKSELYAALRGQLESLLYGERDFIANAANFSSLLYHTLPDLNWAGFYIRRDEELVLGPFQGKPACIRIAMGRGVCGTAAASWSTLVVPDVHAFEGHIACDSASRSEIVIPLITDGRVIGVLDLDSPLYNRFDEDDREGLEKLVRIFVTSSDLP